MTGRGSRAGKVFTGLLGALALAGLAIILIRFAEGLGAVSNMADGRPWGLWIALDIYSGVALAAGGFTLTAAVYIFRLKKYYPIVRSAVLTAFIGYLMVILALVVDLGQPWRLWHIMIYWNTSSPLFEVGWCVLLYTLVLALEFSPGVFERYGLRAPLRLIRAIEIPLVILGIALSTMHQSALGSALLMTPTKLHSLWFSPLLPVLFLLSAVPVGLAAVMVENSLAARFGGPRVDPEIISGLGRALPWLVGLYLTVRVVDLALAGKLAHAFSGDLFSLLFLIEVGAGMLLPLLLLARAGRPGSTGIYLGAALLVILGVVLNRFNSSLVAMATHPVYIYYPSPAEILVSVGIIALGILGYLAADRYVVLPPREAD